MNRKKIPQKHRKKSDNTPNSDSLEQDDGRSSISGDDVVTEIDEVNKRTLEAVRRYEE